MRIFHYDISGLFTCEGVADESPLEPGVYLIPAGATVVEPPETEDGQLARWDGSNWQIENVPVPVELEPAVPTRVTMRQARLALLGAGLLDDVEAAISAMGDTPEGKVARIEWDYSSEVHRNKPFVQQLGAAVGLDEQQLDQLFITASGIE